MKGEGKPLPLSDLIGYDGEITAQAAALVHDRAITPQGDEASRTILDTMTQFEQLRDQTGVPFVITAGRDDNKTLIFTIPFLDKQEKIYSKPTAHFLIMSKKGYFALQVSTLFSTQSLLYQHIFAIAQKGKQGQNVQVVYELQGEDEMPRLSFAFGRQFPFRRNQIHIGTTSTPLSQTESARITSLNTTEGMETALIIMKNTINYVQEVIEQRAKYDAEIKYSAAKRKMKLGDPLEHESQPFIPDPPDTTEENLYLLELANAHRQLQSLTSFYEIMRYLPELAQMPYLHQLAYQLQQNTNQEATQWIKALEIGVLQRVDKEHTQGNRSQMIELIVGQAFVHLRNKPFIIHHSEALQAGAAGELVTIAAGLPSGENLIPENLLPEIRDHLAVSAGILTESNKAQQNINRFIYGINYLPPEHTELLANEALKKIKSLYAIGELRSFFESPLHRNTMHALQILINEKTWEQSVAINFIRKMKDDIDMTVQSRNKNDEIFLKTPTKLSETELRKLIRNRLPGRIPGFHVDETYKRTVDYCLLLYAVHEVIQLEQEIFERGQILDTTDQRVRDEFDFYAALISEL